MAEQEYIPTYPTIAFASRADHLAWIAAQEAQPEAQPEAPPELLTKAAINALKLTVKEIDSIHEMLLPENDRKVKTVLKLVEIHTYANTSTDHYADYTVALQHVRGG